MKNIKIACIVLNRNLGQVTDNLVCQIQDSYSNIDIFVVDGGSEEDLKSKFTTWHINTEEVKINGLRFARGINFGLYQLNITKKLNDYDYFFLVANDAVIKTKNFTKKIIEIMEENPSVGILSPCGSEWGEKKVLKSNKLKFFWFIHNNFYVLRKKCLLDLININSEYKNFFYDGDNFRGFMIESEIIAKCYLSSWGAAVTNQVIIDENDTYLIEKSDLIKTDPFDENMKQGILEGERWIKDKYGFLNPWQMHFYVKFCYDNYFKLNPQNISYKI